MGPQGCTQLLTTQTSKDLLSDNEKECASFIHYLFI